MRLCSRDQQLSIRRDHKTSISDVFVQSQRAREAEAKCDHVCLDFRGKDAEHSQSGEDAGCAVSGPDGTKLPRTGHPDPWRPDQEKPSGLAPRAALGAALVLARPARRKLVDLESRGVSQRGAIQIHPLIRLACDSWQRRDQQLSIRRGSVRSSVLVWNAAARSRIGATAGGYRRRPNSANRAANGKRRKTLAVCPVKVRSFCASKQQKNAHFH